MFLPIAWGGRSSWAASGGYDYVADPNLIEVHISALRAKLGDSARQIIRTVRGVGYTLRG